MLQPNSAVNHLKNPASPPHSPCSHLCWHHLQNTEFQASPDASVIWKSVRSAPRARSGLWPGSTFSPTNFSVQIGNYAAANTGWFCAAAAAAADSRACCYCCSGLRCCDLCCNNVTEQGKKIPVSKDNWLTILTVTAPRS